TFWHGTHVAGIIAAADNGIGTIGIAPGATLIGVKVLHGGSGQFSWMIQGILYAATPIEEGGAGAHIINLSLGALLDQKAKEIKHAVKDLMKAIDRAMAYAHKRGVTVIAAAGNDAINTDAMKELTFAPAANLHGISDSATGPMGWALGATDFDRPASYSNFGRSLVDIAGPGGDFALPGEDLCVLNTLQGPVIQLCWVLDMVISTVRGSSNASYGWAAGTSMAAPAGRGRRGAPPRAARPDAARRAPGAAPPDRARERQRPVLRPRVRGCVECGDVGRASRPAPGLTA